MQRRLVVSDVSVNPMWESGRLRVATVAAPIRTRAMCLIAAAPTPIVWAPRPAAWSPSWSDRLTFRIEIIAEIYAQALQANGFERGRRPGIGSRETYVPALKDHSIDLVPEYIGNLLLYFAPNSGDHAGRGRAGAAPAIAGRSLDSDPAAASDTDTVTVTKRPPKSGI